ncbi:hypothetical protein GCM10020358_37650 [Amorphoplanes nipponensis]|uniref:BTAD domain-containing putative transcriptional regulator n=1 Tax=Actinoplanes nipponensis TaxID=135950 RepID=UPI0031E95B55
MGDVVTFSVLGPVRAGTALGPVPLKGPRHRAVLARLLIARGRVVPVDRLVDDLWERPPKGAVPALRTFVSDLRRALEPDRAPRQPARLLVTAPPGYALPAAPDAVDAWRFEAAVAAAGDLLAAGAASPALAGLEAALGLWHGPAYAEYAGQHWARAEIDRLDELRMLALERRGEALLTLGRAAEAASGLREHAAAQPLREDAWGLLALALYRAGRQGAALAALREVRAALADELGVDPGPRLQRLAADILAQAPHLSPDAAVRPGLDAVAGPSSAGSAPAGPPRAGPDLSTAFRGPGHGPDPAGPGRGAACPGPDPAGPGRGAASPGPDPAGPGRGAASPRPDPAGPGLAGSAADGLFGRDEELGRLVGLADAVAARGRAALALVSGDAGAGKTALAEALSRRLTARGWTATWGHGPGHDGAPVTWPGGQEPEAAAGDPAVARFRARRAAVARLTAPAARGRPVLLVADDLHRADEGTLELLAALVVEAVPVLVVGTFRATEITPELTAALARFARTEPVRVYLGGLGEAAAGALARTVAGAGLDASAARLIHRRSGGNPFFVRELARLFAAEGGAALDRVPAGVRDVIRHRLARLPEPALTVLRQAAVLGRDVDPELLTLLTGDEAAVLDGLDAALTEGLLTEEGPGGRPRFGHLLVRDTIYGDLSALRRAHWHAAAGEALERLRPGDVAALAHHFARAATPATAARAARYSAAAADRAERGSRPHEAARLWRQAIDAYDRGTPAEARGRLAAVMGLGRALAVTGHLDAARRLRAEAVAAVRHLDDPDLAATVLAAFAVPAVWTRNDDDQLSRQVVEEAERILAGPGALRPEQRSRLLSTIALELRGTTTGRGGPGGPRGRGHRPADRGSGAAGVRPQRAVHAHVRPRRAGRRAGRARGRAAHAGRRERAGHLRGAGPPDPHAGPQRAGRARCRGRPRGGRGPAGRALRAAAGGGADPVVRRAAPGPGRPGGGGGRRVPGRAGQAGRQRHAGDGGRAAGPGPADLGWGRRPGRRLRPVRAVGPAAGAARQGRSGGGGGGAAGRTGISARPAA